jgi:4-hydroxybenzoate polyprenyltransferase
MNIPLCVDCDGTLLKTDFLHEALFLLLKQSPASIFLLPVWLMRGKAYFKQQIATRVKINYELLPLHDEVINTINEARSKGRHVVLATASPQIWAQGLADKLNLFHEVIASDALNNLSGSAKAKKLVDRFGDKQFDYIGNDHIDLQVWAKSAGAIVVSNDSSLIKKATRLTEVKRVINSKKSTFQPYFKALRPHQWLKNLLVWLPLAAAHQLSSASGLVNGLFAFTSFSLCASAVYIINDLLDLESDRAHLRKRKRPFASANIPIWQGTLMVPVLLLSSMLLALHLPTEFLIVLGFYFIMTLAYSLRLKRQVIVDVILLAGLYTIRVIAGAAATATIPSFWLLALSMFIFLSLAMIKRYSELLVTLQEQKTETAGRGYQITDLPVLMSIGVSAGIASVMVLALYVNSPESTALYQHKVWLWLAPPLLLYWISRCWMKAHRGEVDDDPVIFAIRDWQSLTICAALLFLVWLAI